MTRTCDTWHAKALREMDGGQSAVRRGSVPPLNLNTSDESFARVSDVVIDDGKVLKVRSATVLSQCEFDVRQRESLMRER